jgi:hypothetical protein
MEYAAMTSVSPACSSRLRANLRRSCSAASERLTVSRTKSADVTIAGPSLRMRNAAEAAVHGGICTIASTLSF